MAQILRSLISSKKMYGNDLPFGLLVRTSSYTAFFAKSRGIAHSMCAKAAPRYILPQM
jgi:hypothetical protein